MRSISEPQPKKKKQRYGTYDKIQQAKIAKWGIVLRVSLQLENLAFSSQRYEELSITIKKPKLKMKNSEKFQERIVARKNLPSELDDKVLQMIKTGCAVKCQLFWQAIKPFKRKWWKFKVERKLFMVSINFSWNWLYQKANNNS